MSDFVHLHVHSEYSLLDGACKIEDLPKIAKARGQKAIALTDHGNMFGAVKFYKACKKENIQPIIGCEVYVAPQSRLDKTRMNDSAYYHLILLVKNEIGYQNLSRLVSAGFIDGFYVKPRIDIELLKKYSEGLICLSGCIAGYLPKCILRNDRRGALDNVYQMKEIFGDDYYLEIQSHGIEEEKIVLENLIQISKETNTELVCTNDVHYLNPEDYDMQTMLMSIRTGNTINDSQKIAFPVNEFYLKSSDSMENLFKEYPSAVQNTVKIAKKCQFDFLFGQIQLPKFHLENGQSSTEYLTRLVYQGYEQRIKDESIRFTDKHPKEEYDARLAYELSVITEMGYDDYFLIVWDFINFAKENGIPVGPGRGSGAGSLVAFALKITEADPIQYDLLFERFLNKERISMPDIDTDFCYFRRDEVIEYVKKRYGTDHVCQIVTFGTMAAKASIKDVGRYLDIPYATVDKVTKLISKKLHATIQDSIEESAQLKELYENDGEVKKTIDYAMRIEGMPRHASTHAAGVVITDRPLTDYVPLSTNGDIIVTQYDMDTIAELGLLKFDFLAIRYLTILDNAEKMIQRKNPSFSLKKISYEDQDVYQYISQGKTDGVFQLESEGIKQVLQRMQPKCLEDIIACISLYRPGPMDSIPKFIECKNDASKIQYKTPLIEPILHATYGCIVYQEQVMQIFSKVGGYSYGRADIVRRAMSKKKMAELLKEKETFIEGAKKNGVSEQIATDLFEEMQSFAEYAYNKSHATVYSITCYQCAYLKSKFPEEYYASLISSVVGDTDKMTYYLNECAKRSIQVLPPSVNESDMDFSVDDNGNIRFGLLALRNVGVSLIDSLVKERTENGKYTDFVDFIFRLKEKDITKRQVESLIRSGACDCFGLHRSQMLSKYEEIVDSALNLAKTTSNGQIDLFFGLDSDVGGNVMPKFEFEDIPELLKKDLLLGEKEFCGLYFSGHLLDSYSSHLSKIKKVDISTLKDLEERAFVTVAGMVTKKVVRKTKNGEEMATIWLNDGTGEVEIVVFPKSYAKNIPLLIVDDVLAVTGTISVQEDESINLIFQKAETVLQNGQEIPSSKKLYLKVESIHHPLVLKITEILKEFSGETEIVFYDTSEKKYSKASSLKINATEQVIEALQDLLGKDNVVFQ